MYSSWPSVLAMVCLTLQLPAVAILFSRLIRGPFRTLPLSSELSTPDLLGTVSVVVPTLNEAARIGPCLDGLRQQGDEVREIWVVDSRSQDGTPELVEQAAQRDPRFHLMTDEALPKGWVGRPWALHSGFGKISEHSTWFLGLDADTQPQPGLVASLVKAAIAQNLDLVSLSPRFILKYGGEIWLQPALLMTLVYRFGPAGETGTPPERVMANGQCFLCRRSLLEQLRGYESARNSFCDDVTLARYAAAQGARVGFLDGANILKVRMYEGIVETWREWGRSLDLKDASSPGQTYGDLWFLASVQGFPLLLLSLLMYSGVDTPMVLGAIGLNGLLVAIRVALSWAIAPSYDLSQSKARWLFWFSPLADPFAVLRIGLSALQRPKQWRGRTYG